MTATEIEHDELIGRLAIAVHVGRSRGGARHLAQALAVGGPFTFLSVRCRLAGWSVLSTDGVTAPVVTILNGANANSEVVGFATPALGLSQSFMVAPPGVECSNGLGVVLAGGAATVALYYYPEP